MSNDTDIEKRSAEDLVIEFREASVSESTRKAYRSDLESFVSYCEWTGVAAIPATQDTVCLYLAELVRHKRAVNTIIRALTAINKAHELAGYPGIRTPEVKAVLKGIKRKNEREKRKASGISYAELVRMVGKCNDRFLGARDRALLWLGWCSAMRRSEIANINIGDLEFTDEGLLISIRRSKTDQEGHGQIVAIPRAAEKTLCPVSAVIDWLYRIPAKELESDRAVFRVIGQGAKLGWTASELGPRLSDKSISLVVRKYAILAGLKNANRRSAHSLRRGLATEAASLGVPEMIIARHTRHASLSSLREYVELGTCWQQNPLSVIYLTRPSATSLSRPLENGKTTVIE
jgi:site-specific recombinase XerD